MPKISLEFPHYIRSVHLITKQHEERKMAATELQQLGYSNKGSLPDEEESQISSSGRKRGGWITFPFITGAVAGLNLAAGGWMANLIVYLIQEFNMKSINAAQVSNVVNGCISLFPVIGAIIADSFLDCFSVVSVSSCISLSGIFLLTLTATITSLRPKTCEAVSSLCSSPSKVQLAILFTGIALASIGLGGSRFSLATMGANQFDNPIDQGIFFNWFFFTMYISSVISTTAIVYIQDNVSWALGFGVAVTVNLIGLLVFLLGKRFFRHVKPQGSPFADLARVVVATIRKRKVPLSSKSEDYYHNDSNGVTITNVVAPAPTKSFRFLNHAALKTEGDDQPVHSTAKTWRLCTVQQVEDFKALIRISPLWSTAIFVSTPIAIQSSLTVLQALTMDRHLGPHFQIPAGSILVIVLLSTSITLTVIDRFLLPTWQKLTGYYPTPLQRIGVGHVLNVLGMVVSALVEAKRLKIAHLHHPLQAPPSSIVPILALWLFPQLVLVGIGEAFHFPGQVALYYQEFPTSLKTTSTAMIVMIIGIAFYLSTALIDLVRRVTGWLPDNINNGRLDNVYWMLVVVGVLNFCYYLVCARFYKYQNVVEKGSDSNGSSKVDG